MKAFYFTPTSAILAAVSVPVLMLSGCERKSEPEKAADEIGDKIEDVADEVGDAVEEATE